MVAENIEMPDAMETIFQSALTFGKNGGVSVIYSKKINFVICWFASKVICTYDNY